VDTELTDEQIDKIARPYILSVGDYGCSEKAIPDNGSIEDFARAVIAADRERQDALHREELAAYELMVSNLRAAQGGPDIRALFWQLRSKLFKLPRYSFLSPQGGGVVKVPDNCGKWIEVDDAAGLCEVEEVDALIAAAPQPAAQPCLDKGRIRAIFMDHGFTIKEGQSDLKEYVYDAANALLAAAAPQPVAQPALCDSCNGSGEAEYMTSHLGPDDYSVSGQCMTCGGSGVAAPQPAAQQERKPYDHPDDDDPWLSGDDMMGDN